MLNLCNSTNANVYDYSLVNWEEDISEVTVVACDTEEDSLGYRVIFYSEGGDEMVASYSIGGSLLEDRLYKLNRAGFDAPMTREALKMIENRRLSFITH